jgi:hypothetical protein
MQKDGKLSKKYKIMIGLRSDGVKPFEDFSNEKFAIIVSTRFSIESLNYPAIKGIVLTHFFNSIIDAYQTWGRGIRPYLNKDCYVSVPVFGNRIKQNPYIWLMNRVLLDEPIKEYNEIDYTEIKEWDIDDLVNVDSVTGGHEEVKPQVEVDKDETNTPAENIHIDTILSQITSEDFGGILKGTGSFYSFTEKEIFASALKKDKKGNIINTKPTIWRANDPIIASHAYSRTRFSEGKDDIWIRATAHMEHRTSIDTDDRLRQVYEAIDDVKSFRGVNGPHSEFLRKYPKLVNWLKSNPKQKEQRKDTNGNVISMDILLPHFRRGTYGWVTKELLLESKEKAINLTEWAKLISPNMPHQSLQVLCENLGIDFKDKIIPIEIRAKQNGAKSKMIRTKKGQFSKPE